jgi:hypothetical protein
MPEERSASRQTRSSLPLAKLCHVGLRPGLVEEDQTSGIDQGLTGAPAPAVAAYIWPIPLPCDEGLFKRYARFVYRRS